MMDTSPLLASARTRKSPQGQHGGISGEGMGSHQVARLVAARENIIDHLAKRLPVGGKARVLLTQEGEGLVDGLHEVADTRREVSRVRRA